MKSFKLLVLKNEHPYQCPAPPEQRLYPAEDGEPAEEPHRPANVADHVHQRHRRCLHDAERKLLRDVDVHLYFPNIIKFKTIKI